MVDVVAVRYHPHDADYRLAIEIIDAAELRARVASDPQRGFERVDFQCVLFVRSGSYDHVVDFETHRLVGGSALVISPGQVHRFGPPGRWEGWMLILDTHLVPEDARSLPTHVRLDDDAAQATTELFARLEADTRSAAHPADLVRLLERQVAVLMARLALGGTGAEPDRQVDPLVSSRHRAYRAAVEEGFRRCHLVAPYARDLGCSTRSLNRACQAVAGVSAKQVVVARLVLEAKRVLAHTDDTVSTISRSLGFDEPTNFVKFFRRETATTPTAFRHAVRAHRAI
ncbi:AraC family transcriptional regulator [Rhabdothermincola salaria]|uniref:AraC family transcriptional regulator n=1 Tax=Rhabdothermincola salaria TaxID=2903142 RepID=UPI001E42ABF1|nr:helix-turn-helix domain-containing protein [Rhabdothermincola salaria]MCD9623964.1 AraC family transcriptional regulator [Rhabdothermincola salaria]